MRRSLSALLVILSTAWAGSALAADGPSRLQVIGLSLLFPGLGHRAIGHSTRGAAFMAADVGLWGTLATYRIQGHLRRDSYIDMAGLFAGVRRPDGRSDEYYRWLGQFASSDEYDEEIRREARARFGDDLAGREAYFQAHRIPDDQAWRWSSEAEWDRYRDKRSASQLSYKRARYMLALTVANRLVATVDAMRVFHSHSRSEGTALYFSGDPFDLREPVRLCVSRWFP